jgi:hypothetical protein
MAKKGLKSLSISTDQLAQRIEYDVNNNPIYIGETFSCNQRQQSQPVWRIKRIYWDANQNAFATLWANGDMNFKFRWDQRATYTYG